MLLPILQIIISVLLIVFILLQERSAGISGLFGRGEGSFYQTRRGMEKIIFWGTIFLTIAFIALAIISLTIK